MDNDLKILQTALTQRRLRATGGKAACYVDQFFELRRIGMKIVARVVGNHGTYTVSIEPVTPTGLFQHAVATSANTAVAIIAQHWRLPF